MQLVKKDRRDIMVTKAFLLFLFFARRSSTEDILREIESCEFGSVIKENITIAILQAINDFLLDGHIKIDRGPSGDAFLLTEKGHNVCRGLVSMLSYGSDNEDYVIGYENIISVFGLVYTDRYMAAYGDDLSCLTERHRHIYDPEYMDYIEAASALDDPEFDGDIPSSWVIGFTTGLLFSSEHHVH